MKRLSLIASALAVLGLTACEKELVEDIEDVGSGQVKNSLLQVRTRSGGSTDEATVSYPVTVYVFQGEECRAAHAIGDEGQTLNIPLVEGTYSVYAIGGASADDYVLPEADKFGYCTSRGALTQWLDGSINHGDAHRWWHEYRHTGYDEKDDAHSGRDYQEDSNGGNGGEFDNSTALASPHRRRHV